MKQRTQIQKPYHENKATYRDVLYEFDLKEMRWGAERGAKDSVFGVRIGMTLFFLVADETEWFEWFPGNNRQMLTPE